VVSANHVCCIPLPRKICIIYGAIYPKYHTSGLLFQECFTNLRSQITRQVYKSRYLPISSPVQYLRRSCLPNTMQSWNHYVHEYLALYQQSLASWNFTKKNQFTFLFTFPQYRHLLSMVVLSIYGGQPHRWLCIQSTAAAAADVAWSITG